MNPLAVGGNDAELGAAPGLVIIPDKPTKAEKRQLKQADKALADALDAQKALENAQH